MNSAWHDKHRITRNATLDERVKWHVAHAEACGCRPMPDSIRAEVARAKGKAPSGAAPRPRKKAATHLTKSAAGRAKKARVARAEPVLHDPDFETVVNALSKERGVTYGGKGFGSSALKLGGKIFAMLSSKGDFVVKLSKARVDELVADAVGSYFDPGRGRLMKEWLSVSAGPKRWLALAREALAFGRGSQS